MTCTALTAGVDVGKTYLDLGFHPAAKPVRCTDDARGIARLVDLVKKRGATRVAIEAIGPYAQRLVAALAGAGLAVAIVDPRRIRAFRTAEGRIAKTDPLDAGLIARFAHVMTEHLRPAPSADQIALKALSTRRRQLTELIAMEKTRLAQAVEDGILASHKAVIKALEAACDEVEGELARRIDVDGALARKREILLSIPGIGARIAPLLITDMPELGTLDRKAVASLAGLAPHPNQSGVGPGRNAIAGGRPCIRSAFYMAGMVAARSSPAFKGTYRAMRESGKPPKVAIIAMGRRLALLANALLRENKLFEDSTLSKTDPDPSKAG